MSRLIFVPMIFVVVGCSGGDPVADNLENAAEVSDPAAAQVLNSTAEALREQDGTAPPGAAQEALRQAGEAQAQRNVEPSSTLQARPNLPRDPNRPRAGQPPEKIDVAENSQDEHAGHEAGNQQ